MCGFAPLDDDDNDEQFHVKHCNEEDEDNSAGSAPDPVVESEGEEDDSSDDKEIPRTPDCRGSQTSSSKQNVEKMKSRMNMGEEREEDWQRNQGRQGWETRLIAKQRASRRDHQSRQGWTLIRCNLSTRTLEKNQCAIGNHM